MDRDADGIKHRYGDTDREKNTTGLKDRFNFNFPIFLTASIKQQTSTDGILQL